MVDTNPTRQPGHRAVIQRVIDLGICTKCGRVHDRCSAHRKSDGAPCGYMAAEHQTICRFHGAGAPQNINAALERAKDAEAETLLRRKLGDTQPREIRNPTIALARLAGEMEQTKEAAAQLLVELLDPTTATATGIDIHPYVKLYERALGRYQSILVDMARIGIEDRIAGVEELEAQIQLGAILAGLADAGVDTPQVRAAIAARLRALPA